MAEVLLDMRGIRHFNGIADWEIEKRINGKGPKLEGQITANVL